MKNRHNDIRGRVFKRMNRYLQFSEGFYFATREGHQFGPYKKLQQVTAARHLFVFLVTGNNSRIRNESINKNHKLLVIEQITATKVLAQRVFS